MCAEAEETLACCGGRRIFAPDLGVHTGGKRGLRDRPPNVPRDGVERPPAGVEADEDGAHAVLVHDRRAERRDADVGDRAEGHDAPIGRHQREAREPLGIRRCVGGDADDDVGLPLALDETPDGEPAERAPYGALDGGRAHTVQQEIIAPRMDAQSGGRECPWRVQARDARHRRHPLAHRHRRLLETRELEPAQPDDDVRAGAADQLLDALVQELLQVEREAGHIPRPFADRVRHRLRVDLGREVHHHLAALRTPDVLRERRAADDLRHGLDPVHREESFSHRGTHAKRLGEADARGAGHVHHEVRLVELGEELEVGERREADGQHDRREAAGEDGGGARERARQRPLVGAAKRHEKPRRRRTARHGAGQQHERERRRDRQRDPERRQRGEHVGERERPEERPLETPEQEDRQEHQRHHHRRVDDRAPDLDGSSEHDVERTGARRRRAQPSPRVLDVDDRVVHYLADGNREAAEDHDVERRPRRPQHHHGREQRERDGDHAHQRHAELRGEDQQHDGHEDGAGEQRAAQVAERVGHEARLAEHPPLDAHPFRQRADDRVERVLHGRGDGEDVLVRLLRDEKHDAGVSVDDRVTHGDRGTLAHLGDAGERHGDVVAPRERCARQVSRAVQPAVEPGRQPLAAAVEEPGAARRIGGAGGRRQIVQRRVRGEEALGRGRHLHLADTAAIDDDVGDARHREQPRPDRPFREVAQDQG